MEKLLNARGPILRTNKSLFSNGNYDCYYQFRHSRTADIDPRLRSILSVLHREFFLGKSVIELGCNTGLICFQTAAIFGARKVLGIDIDSTLIFKALGQLRKFKTIGLRIEEPPKKRQRWGQTDDQLPTSLVRTRGPPIHVSKPWTVPPELRVTPPPDTPISERFPFNLEFRAENALEAVGSADCVFAFSLTKWVQLNGGDSAVKELFSRAQKLLRPGGHFFLEAEEWKGYKVKKNATLEIRRNFENLRFRPSQFSDYLIETLGFLRGPVIPPFRPIRGFDRPIQVFTLPS